MSKRSRIITSILTVLFAITAVSALTVYAENMDEDPGGGQSGYSEEQGNQGGNDGDSGNQGGGSDSDSGNQGGGNEGGSGSDYQPQHDYGNDSDYGNNYGNDDDNDSNYNSNYNSYSNRSSNNYDDDGGSDSYYDMDGNRYSNSSDIYVGGDQTYTPPVTIPETTAALYDTSTAKIDNQTLTGNDWKEIQAKLTEASNNANSKDVDTGDFAFIQKNTEVEDNGHWMLILGFALIILSVIGFVILIARAGERKRVPAYRGAGAAAARKAPRYRSEKAPAAAAADTKTDAEPDADAAAAVEADADADADTDKDADIDDDIDADIDADTDTKPEPAKPDKASEKPKKRSKKGTRYRKD